MESMLSRKRVKSGSKDKEEIGILPVIRKIQRGNKLLREELIRNFTPFIKKKIYECTSISRGEIEVSDEYSIALWAFNTAIDKFDTSRETNFFSYAAQVIKNKLYNYFSSENRNAGACPISFFEDMPGNMLDKLSCCGSFDYYGKVDLSLEIDSFEGKLREYEITIDQLLDLSPKHRDSRELCLRIAKVIAEDEDMFLKLYDKGVLPRNELLKKLNINKKVIDKNRKFIIAAALIIGNGFNMLKDFVDIPKEEVGGF